MGARTFSDLITFTRASTGTYFDGAGVMQTAAVDQPRIDYDPATGEKLGLLVEEQRTNLLTYSEQFDDAAWTKASSRTEVLANQIISPDGTLSADLVRAITGSTTGEQYARQSITLTNGVTYTFSCYIKKANWRYANVRAAATNAIFDFDSESFTFSTGVVTTIQSVGNGWYRVSVSQSASSTATFYPGVGVTPSGTEIAWSTAPTNNEGVYIWGAQLEAGAFPTSYIPTTSAQVTRSADVASITGTNFSDWYRQEEGTLVAHWAYQDAFGSIGNPMTCVGFSDGTINNRIRITTNLFEGAVGGTAQFSFSLTLPSTSKVAAVYNANDFAVSVNGGAVSTDTSGTVPPITQLQLGDLMTGRGLTGYIRKIAYYPKRLTDAELQAMTA